jgi:DNA mismatch repair protein MutL
MTVGRIRKLSRNLINRIAAGEVVERPASVVKEMVENAIDAEATHIEVHLEDGGRRLIRVTDNGIGIAPDDLPLVFESHATSKLEETNDLFEIYTFGFRGEAMASIGSVSHCRAVSRARGAEVGAELECNGGELGDVRTAGAPPGTIIEVRDLFYNTPARLKFMRTTATELRHATEAITRLALPHPGLSILLTHNKRTVLKLEPSKTPRGRLGAIFGEDLCAKMLPVHSESSALTISGYISAPGTGQSNNQQYIFLNGRYIRDRAIQRAIYQAYRTRMLKGRYPAIFLNLVIDPSRVDVNVHPTKIEVRFRDSGAVFAQMLTALEKTLSGAGPAQASLPPAQRPPTRTEIKDSLANLFDGKPDTPTAAAPEAPRAPEMEEADRLPRAFADTPSTPTAPAKPHEIDSLDIGPLPQHKAHRFFQIHNAYIVEQTDDGLHIIDQHALHERILYEDLRARAANAAVPRQRLLVPELIELRAQDFMRVMEMKDDLRRFGVEVEEFGDRTIAVQAVPHIASAIDARDLIEELLESDIPADGQPTERQDRILQMVACKAAVKAGDPLGHAQIDALLDQRDLLGPEPTCPHGRPTTILLSLSELEKQFRRK